MKEKKQKQKCLMLQFSSQIMSSNKKSLQRESNGLKKAFTEFALSKSKL